MFCNKADLKKKSVWVTQPQHSCFPNEKHNLTYLRNKLVSSWTELRNDTGLTCQGEMHIMSTCVGKALAMETRKVGLLHLPAGKGSPGQPQGCCTEAHAIHMASALGPL